MYSPGGSVILEYRIQAKYEYGTCRTGPGCGDGGGEIRDACKDKVSAVSSLECDARAELTVVLERMRMRMREDTWYYIKTLYGVSPFDGGIMSRKAKRQT